MASYKISNMAKEDLIRIHNYGVFKFGEAQADKYYDSFFVCFERIAKRPYSFESIDHIKSGYRRCVCGSDSIYYRINDNITEIMTIIGSQDIESIIL
jgi:toxin ParE1/3/4